MNTTTARRLLVAMCMSLTPITQAQVLAFDGAEGFGAYATGARTNLSSASVYHVTNLNDSGAGSFRDAVSQSNRFVVFDVAGIINLESVVQVSSNITIAGQTAPGSVSLYGDRISFTGSDNLIARHFGVRMGTAPGRVDAASIARGQNMMFDHMSITWGVDGTFDINPDSGYVIDNITIQDSIIGQGLDVVGHSTGGLVQPGEGGSTSMIRNLWADHVTRNPKVRYENEFINNVVYGYETAGYIMGDTNNADSHANVIGNYFIEGPVNGSSPFASGTSRFNIYGDDNWVDDNRNGTLDGFETNTYPGATVVGAAHSFGTNTAAAMSAQDAVAYVMQHAGPSIFRDAVDTRLMEEVASYGTLGGVIVRESDLFPGWGSDPQYLITRARFLDADYDGMADLWEGANGLSASDANDWRNLSAAGYTQLEEYVNELGASGEIIVSSGGTWSNTSTWSGASPTLADELVIVGNVSNSGDAFARRLAINGQLTMTGGSLSVFDTAEFSNGTSTINGGTAAFGQLLVGSTGNNATLALTGGAVLQTGTITDAGGNGTLHMDGGAIYATGVPIFTLDTTLGAGGGTIDTAGFVGIHTGQISGSGALTKRGGQLTLAGDNSYSGGTHVSGVLRLAHDNAAGTGAISIGSSFGQVELVDGVTISNDLVTDYIFEVINIADDNSTATFAGDVSTARSSGQIRMQTTGGGSGLILTGNVDAGSSFFIFKTGAVDLREDATLTAGSAIVGRDGGITYFTLSNNATANVNNLSIGGGKGLQLGRVTVRDDAGLNVAGNVDLLSTDSTTSASEINLNGGVATVGGFVKSSTGATQTSEINFNGGTLRYGGSTANANFLTDLDGLVANVQAGGARIDTNGQAITIAQSLVHDASLSGADGGLTKIGNGTLILTGVNTYNGSTWVQAGTLDVRGSHTANAGYTVAGGATLSGAGSIAGSVTVQGGGTFAPGPGSSAWTVDSLQLQPGSVALFEIGGVVAGTDYGQAIVAGAAELGGTLDIRLTHGYAPDAGDSFDLFNLATRTGTFSNLSLPTLGPGLGWHLGELYSDGELHIELLGDLNLDERVGIEDLDLVLANWGGSTLAFDYAAGDASGDGLVGEADLQLVIDYWGNGVSGGENVPEPASGLAFVSLAAMLWHRRR